MKFFNEYYRLNRYLNPYPDRPDKKEEKILDFIMYLEKYVNLATVQMQRLFDDEQEMELAQGKYRPQSVENSIPFIKFSGDIHFLFNCFDKVLKISRKLAEFMKDAQLKQIIENHSELKIYIKARNSFEHMDERIERTNWFREDLSSIGDFTLTLDGIDYRLTKDSLLPLYSLYESIVKRIDDIVEPRKEDIDKFWKPFDERVNKHWDDIYEN